MHKCSLETGRDPALKNPKGLLDVYSGKPSFLGSGSQKLAARPIT